MLANNTLFFLSPPFDANELTPSDFKERGIDDEHATRRLETLQMQALNERQRGDLAQEQLERAQQTAGMHSRSGDVVISTSPSILLCVYVFECAFLYLTLCLWSFLF